MKTFLAYSLLLSLSSAALGCSRALTEVGSNTAGTAGETSSNVGGSSAKGGSSTNGGSSARGGSSTKGGASARGGANTAGNSSGTAVACAVPMEPITWDFNGGMPSPLIPYESPSTLSASGFSHATRTVQQSSSNNVEHLCQTSFDCGNWGPELQTIVSTMESFQVFSRSDFLFGVDPRPVDGSVFVANFGPYRITIGDPCQGEVDCVPVPDNVAALKDALIALEKRAMISCAPECNDPVLPTPESCGMGGKEVWYFDGHACVNRLNCVCTGAACPKLFDSEEACRLAYAHCPSYPSCGGFSETPQNCEASEFCTYPLHDAASRYCGFADAPGLCLARPRACPASTPTSAVCACDTQVYASVCEAGLAGKGPGPLEVCNVSCETKEDCSKFADFCAANPSPNADPGDGTPGTAGCVNAVCACQ